MIFIWDLKSFNLCDDCLFVHLFIWYCFCGALTAHTISDDDLIERIFVFCLLFYDILFNHRTNFRFCLLFYNILFYDILFYEILFKKNALSTHPVWIYILFYILFNLQCLLEQCCDFSLFQVLSMKL